jgi:hypothetical protein
MLILNKSNKTIQASKLIKPQCVVELDKGEFEKLFKMYPFLIELKPEVEEVAETKATKQK